MRKTRQNKNIGLWSPSCVQHGFTDNIPFADERWKVKGLTVAEAIQNFLNNSENGQWLLDDGPWPTNEGCSGRSHNKINNILNRI